MKSLFFLTLNLEINQPINWSEITATQLQNDNEIIKPGLGTVRGKQSTSTKWKQFYTLNKSSANKSRVRKFQISSLTKTMRTPVMQALLIAMQEETVGLIFLAKTVKALEEFASLLCYLPTSPKPCALKVCQMD